MKVENINNNNIYTNSIGKKEEEISFETIVKNQIDKLNETQNKSNDSINSLLKGEDIELHQVMLTMEEAKISLQLAVEIRNKVVDAYNEISRMQV